MDIGCGIGAVANDVAQVAKQVVGMDFNETSIKITHRKIPPATIWSFGWGTR